MSAHRTHGACLFLLGLILGHRFGHSIEFREGYRFAKYTVMGKTIHNITSPNYPADVYTTTSKSSIDIIATLSRPGVLHIKHHGVVPAGCMSPDYIILIARQGSSESRDFYRRCFPSQDDDTLQLSDVVIGNQPNTTFSIRIRLWPLESERSRFRFDFKILPLLSMKPTTDDSISVIESLTVVPSGYIGSYDWFKENQTCESDICYNKLKLTDIPRDATGIEAHLLYFNASSSGKCLDDDSKLKIYTHYNLTINQFNGTSCAGANHTPFFLPLRNSKESTATDIIFEFQTRRKGNLRRFLLRYDTVLRDVGKTTLTSQTTVGLHLINGTWSPTPSTDKPATSTQAGLPVSFFSNSNNVAAVVLTVLILLLVAFVLVWVMYKRRRVTEERITEYRRVEENPKIIAVMAESPEGHQESTSSGPVVQNKLENCTQDDVMPESMPLNASDENVENSIRMSIMSTRREPDGKEDSEALEKNQSSGRIENTINDNDFNISEDIQQRKSTT